MFSFTRLRGLCYTEDVRHHCFASQLSVKRHEISWILKSLIALLPALYHLLHIKFEGTEGTHTSTKVRNANE